MNFYFCNTHLSPTVFILSPSFPTLSISGPSGLQLFLVTLPVYLVIGVIISVIIFFVKKYGQKGHARYLPALLWSLLGAFIGVVINYIIFEILDKTDPAFEDFNVMSIIVLMFLLPILSSLIAGIFGANRSGKKEMTNK